jgi:hypothetical protein
MVRNGSSKPADAQYGANRLAIAKGFHKSAQDQVELAGQGTLGNPIASTIVHAAIAYCDALTATFGSKVNQQDHQAAVKTLRGVMGNRLPKAQETRLSRILGNKDVAQYGGRLMTVDDAVALLTLLDDFSKWVESEMARV